MPETKPLLQVSGLRTVFRAPGRGLPPRVAVQDVSFSLEAGQIMAVVGESGCGKSSLARTIVRLLPAAAGRIHFQGRDITQLGGAALQALRRDLQIVFQDPTSALNPRQCVRQALSEPLRAHGIGTRQDRLARVCEALDIVGLNDDILACYPHEFSGGQRQRIALARALVLRPRLLLADEVVSALDVSVQAKILNLLADLRSELGISLLFISHDLAAVHFIADVVAAMYQGRLVEFGEVNQVFAHPAHPYTRALLRAIPGKIPAERSPAPSSVATGPASEPGFPGCAFHAACPHAMPTCLQKRPAWAAAGTLGAAHRVYCHLYP